MIKTKIIALFAPFFLLADTFVAQQKAADFNNFDPDFEVFTLPGGSLGNSVQGMVQDSAGFLWFASQAGLHRYNGQNFFTYRHDPYNPNSLASDYIEYIFLDSKGILWLAHYSDGGLTSFDTKKEIFTRYQHDPANPETLISNTTSVVAEDREGYIWVGGQSGLDRFDPKTGKFKHFRHDPADPRSLSYDQVRALYVDKKGTLWVGTGFPFDTKNPAGGLNRYDPKTETFTRYVHEPENTNSLVSNKIRAILEDSKGNFWVGTGGDGLHLMNREKGTFARLHYDPANQDKMSAPFVRGTIAATLLPEGHVTSIIEDRDGLIWITGFPGGLNVYDPISGIKRHFEQGKSEGDLSVNHLWQTFQTKDGVTWIASAGVGQKVFKVKRQDDRFPFWGWRTIDGSFRDDKVSGIAKDRDGNVWIGFSTGTPLVRLDHKTNKVLPVPFGGGAPGGFNAREVTSLSLDREGFLWIGTENGLFRRDPQTGKFRYFLPPEAGNTTSFEGILQDRTGYIWAPSWHTGLYRIDLKTGEYTNYPSAPGSIGNGFVWGVFEDEEGNIWASGGSFNDLAHPLLLNRFNPEKATFDHFIKEKEPGCATGLAFDKRGNIWFVDNMNNLQKLNPADGKRRKITPSDGSLYKPANAEISLAQGKDGRIWLYGDNKLFEFDPETEQFYIHGEAHGISPVGDNRSQLHVAHDGEMLICGERGLLAFYPEKIPPAKNSRPPDLRITDFWLHDVRILPGEGSLLDKPVWATSELRLTHDQNLFAFSVACFDFHDPAASQLQFMLEGYDRAWRNDLRGGATPVYVNVPPGEYTFRVRGADSHGVWNMNGASIHITILPPWWETWWAYLLYALAAVGFLFWLRHLDRKKQQQKLAQEQKLNGQLRQVNEATAKFVPNEFLRSLGRANITEVLLGDYTEREVTVLFADLRDYTTLSESMTPEENFNFVMAFNGRMGPIIQQHKGFVNQYLGDGILAIFPENPADALLASIAMQIDLAAYNEYRTTNGRKLIRVGIGIHTGSLIMGIIGDERRLDAATISDAVNTASRLESLSKYYGANIILSKDSLDKIERTNIIGNDGAVSDQQSGGFHVRYLGMVQVKGKHKAVKVYECIDGDKPAVFEKKLATMEVFTAGMQHYLDKQFAAAANAFEVVLQLHPDDATARLFLNKALHFISNGAPEEWTGVEMMEGK